MREYLKGKIYEHARNSKNKNIRDFCIDINEFKMGYQSWTNLVTDAKDDLFANSHNIVSGKITFLSH
jgi:hypothetical protein